MKKLFTLLFASSLLFACSNDTEVSEINEVAVDQSVFDNSNLGIYKGVFTTLDGQNRATVLIELDGKSDPTVNFGFPDGTKAALTSNQKALKGQEINSMSFSGEDFEFDFSVEEDGTNPIITNVTYKGKKGDVIILKETSKAPVSPKTGTYSCESGCFTDGTDNGGDDSNPHPELGAPGAIQTFNFILQGAGDGPITQQYTLNSRVYEGTVLQDNCTLDAFGNVNTCGLFAQPDLNGNTGPIRFRSSANPDNTLAFHSYSVNATIDCSTYEGNAVYQSTLFGQSIVAFKTDDTVGNGGDCR